MKPGTSFRANSSNSTAVVSNVLVPLTPDEPKTRNCHARSASPHGKKLLVSESVSRPGIISPMLCLRMAGGLLIMAFGFSLYQAAAVLAAGHPLL